MPDAGFIAILRSGSSARYISSQPRHLEVAPVDVERALQLSAAARLEPVRSGVPGAIRMTGVDAPDGEVL